MSTPHDQHGAVRYPAMLIAAVSLGACVLIALGGGYLSAQRGGTMSDGLNTLIALVPGVLIASGVLGAMGSRPAPGWSVPVLAMTMVRAVVVLGVGLAVFMIVSPDKPVFFLTLLASLLVTLGIDVASVLSLIQKHPLLPSGAGESEGVC